MYLVQILLPLLNPEGRPFPESVMTNIRNELVDRFGGITAFTQSPADGVWAHGSERVRDEIVLIEVISETLDREWWGKYRRRLEEHLEQDTVVIHATQIEIL